MCVILVCPNEKKRPSQTLLEACHSINPHGAGVAWRERGLVRWMKNLEPDDLSLLIPELPGEIVIHFRFASVGGVDAELCHPFPTTRKAETDLFGAARSVVFQNGTWGEYTAALRRLSLRPGWKQPGGIINDTRTAALYVNAFGKSILSRLPGRWVWMDGKDTHLYGTWSSFRGMKVSNQNFLNRLLRTEQGTDDNCLF